MVKFYSGYIQIQHPDYQERKTINHTFQPSDSLYAVVGNMDEISSYVPRIESYSLFSTGEDTKGGALIGIDPGQEDQLTGLSKWVKKGGYLEPGDEGILLTHNLARNLGAGVGDTLVLISQGYHGASAEGLFPVRGILKFPSPKLNNLGGYVSLKAARDFYWAVDRVTSIVIMLKSYDDLSLVRKTLQTGLGRQYGIITWVEMQPELEQMIEADRSGALIMKAILYMLIGFGILGTIIMMLSERKKEMGIMVAVGMKKGRLIAILIYETVLIGIMGVLAGFAASIPLIATLVKNPIPIPGEAAEAYSEFGLEPVIYFSSGFPVFANQALIVFLIALAVSIYPVIHTLRLESVEALRA